jgi:4'-phosphopantetheinyl transferase
VTEHQRQALKKEAHVWLTRTDHVTISSAPDRYADILSAEEMQRYQRFIFDRDKHLFLVAHATLRVVLSKYENVPPEEWQFERNVYGRPEVAKSMGLSGLRFNLSHAHGLVACVVSDHMDCGVDVERTDRVDDPMSMARRFFSPREVGALQAPQTNETTRNRFFEYWTLKEAYVKAVGKGFSIPLDKFSFVVDKGKRIHVVFHTDMKDDADAWQFVLRYPSRHHILAVALRKNHPVDLPVILRVLKL